MSRPGVRVVGPVSRVNSPPPYSNIGIWTHRACLWFRLAPRILTTQTKAEVKLNGYPWQPD